MAGELQVAGQGQQLAEIPAVVADGAGRLPPLVGQPGQAGPTACRGAHRICLVTRARAAGDHFQASER